MSQHADIDSLDRYLDDRLGEAQAAMVEAHVLACPECRDVLARRAQVEPAAARRHEDSWEQILEGVDQPRLAVSERLLALSRVPRPVARLVAAAPALRQAWLIAGLGLLGVAVLTAHLGSGTVGTVTFVVTAPVVPLVGVALSYGSRGEPAGEVATVAPYRSFRLVVLRTLVVLASWFPAAVILALFLPGRGTTALLWFVPALALCALTLAASTFMDPAPAAAVLGVAWLTAAGLAVRGPRWMPAGELLDQFVAFRPAGQILLAGLAVAGVLVTVARRSTFDTRSAS
jgi:Putative zinc-finger